MKNDGVRQIGSSSQLLGNIKFMFQTNNQVYGSDPAHGCIVRHPRVIECVCARPLKLSTPQFLANQGLGAPQNWWCHFLLQWYHRLKSQGCQHFYWFWLEFYKTCSEWPKQEHPKWQWLQSFSEIGVVMHSDAANKANFTLNHYYK